MGRIDEGMSLLVRRYEAKDAEVWNAFLDISKNATFLFNRSYMDYHRDKFIDHSVLVYDGAKLVALLPANEKNNEIQSHGGLTYGGIVVSNESRLHEVLSIFYHVLHYYEKAGFETILYKCFPSYLSTAPAQEDLYALFLLQAVLYRRDSACIIALDNALPYQQRRQRSIKKAERNGAWVKESATPAYFWEHILSPTLMERHQLKPVHTLEEIQLLMKRFPDAIKLYEAGVEDEVIAGTLIFETKTTVHAQYIATNSTGRDQGTLDFLFSFLLQKAYSHKKYFSFGISNEQSGKVLNRGLQDWKEGFGARTLTLDFHTLSVKNYYLLADYA